MKSFKFEVNKALTGAIMDLANYEATENSYQDIERKVNVSVNIAVDNAVRRKTKIGL